MKLINIFKLLVGVSLIMIFATACGASESAVNNAPPPPPAEAAAGGSSPRTETQWDRQTSMAYGAGDEFDFFAVSADAPANLAPNALLIERMVIRSAHISMNTLYFEETADNVESIIAAYGGFVESSNRWMITIRGEDRWRADYTLRVPVNHFDSATQALMNIGEIASFSASSEDVTTQFQDLESRMNIRLEEERRLVEMIENTDDLEDLLNLERRLSDLRLTIEGQRRRLAEIDNLASFSTITLFLQEVTEEEMGVIPTGNGGEGVITRILAAFDGSISFSLAFLETIAVIIASVILPAGIVVALVFVGLKVVKYFQNILKKV